MKPCSLCACSWQHHLHRTPALNVASAAVDSPCSLLRWSTRPHDTQYRMCRPSFCASSLRTCTRTAALPYAFPTLCQHTSLATRRTYTAKSSSTSAPPFDVERREGSGGSRAEGYMAERDGGSDGAYLTADPWAAAAEEGVEAAAAAGEEGGAATRGATGAKSVEPLSTETNTNVGAEKEKAAESVGDAAPPRGDQSGIERPAGNGAANDAASSSSPSSTEATGEGSSAPTQGREAATAQGGTAGTDAPAAEGEVACSHGGPWDDGGAGLVRRRVAQWYVPGLERAHRSVTFAAEAAPPPKKKITEVVAEVAGITVKGVEAEEEEVAAAAAAATAPAEAPSPQAAATGGGSSNPASDSPTTAAAETASTADAPATVTSPTSAAVASASTNAAAGVVEVADTSAATKAVSKGSAKKSSSSTTATTTKSTEGKTGTDPKVEEDEEDEEDEDEDESLPSTLLTVQANRNKRLKRLLMASLGSDFAKAGLSNDGVRTSFSVVNYQTIKHLTGLSRVPPALLISCLMAPENRFSWIDISMHPTATLSEYKEALGEVLLGLGMHRTMVEDSAEPMLLPQVTVTNGCYSLLMRYAINTPTDKQMDSFQDLTNRFTVFVTKTRVITVHRTQCAYVEELKLNWQQFFSGDGVDGTPSTHRNAGAYSVPKETTATTNSDNKTASSAVPRGLRYLLYYFVKETVGTFTQAIAQCIVEFDRYEANLFSTQRNRSSMARDIYHIKRRASVYGRTLTLTQDAYSHIASALHISSSQVGYQEIMHDLAHVESLAEELNSNADSVLQLLFQLSSYQVNELMRVLTVFSAFFIPLSFIASVYGMNFEDLPMLHNEHGGIYCGVLMIAVASSIFVWFRANRFI